MSEKTFSDKAKDIMNKESDPALQQDLLSQLMEEQETYKAENGMNEPQMAPDQFADGGTFGGGLSYPMEANNPVGFRMNSFGMDQLQNTVPQNPTNLTMQPQNIPQIGGNNFFQSPGMQSAMGVGAQMIPSIASGLLTYFGNRSLQNQANEYADQARDMYSEVEPNFIDYESSKTSLISPEYMSLDRERSEAKRTAKEMSDVSKQNAKSASGSRGEYLANINKSTSNAQRVLGSVLGQSYQNETKMNAAERARVQATNSQNIMANNQFNTQNRLATARYNSGQQSQADQFNAQQQSAANNQYWNFKQQGAGYQQGKYGALSGMLGEFTDIMQYNANLEAMNQGKYAYIPSWKGGQFMYNQGE